MIQIYANMWLHLGTAVWIIRSRLKHNDSQPGISSLPLTKDETQNLTVTPKFAYVYECSLMENVFFDVFE